MNWFGRTHSAEDEDQLDADLDRMVRGQHPEGALAETVERVFQLANEEGLLSSRAIPSPGKPTRQQHPRSFLPRKHWRIAMSLTSTAAVFAVVLTLIIGGMPALIGNNLEPTQLAFQQSATPSAESNGITPVEPRLVTPEDCTVAPRTRAEMLAILQYPPFDGYRQMIDGDGLRPTISVEDLDPGDPVTQQIYDDLQSTVTEWYACTAFLQTWQWASLETNELLRSLVYWNPGFSTVYARNVSDFGYSEATLNEILDDWENTQTIGRNSQRSRGINTMEDMPIIDPSSIYLTADGTYAIVQITFFDSDSITPFPQTSIRLTVESGIWRINSFGGFPF